MTPDGNAAEAQHPFPDDAGSQPSRTRGGVLLRRGLALAIGIALLPALLEVVYRTVRLPGLSPTTHPAYVQHDPELGWSYRPGVATPHKSAVFDVTVEINARGFRGPTWPEREPDRPVVLVLGDSFAFGWGVEYEEGFCALLVAETGWDVRNAAVSGYGTDQQRLLLERLLHEVEPDLVISVFCWNDLFESSTDTVYGKHKPRFVRADDGLALVGTPVAEAPLARWSYVARAFYKWRWQHRHVERVIDRDAEWSLVLDLYREEQRLLQDVPLLIVSDRRRLARFAAETEGIEHLDLRSVFQGATEPLAFADDGHWTPAAHRRIAHGLQEAAEALFSAGER